MPHLNNPAVHCDQGCMWRGVLQRQYCVQALLAATCSVTQAGDVPTLASLQMLAVVFEKDCIIANMHLCSGPVVW